MSDKVCFFYNSSQCFKPSYNFNHVLDQHSLPLVLDGPNIGKDHLLGEDGCKYPSKKEGTECWYSHDLTRPGLPLHDLDAVKEELILAEAWHNKKLMKSYNRWVKDEIQADRGLARNDRHEVKHEADRHPKGRKRARLAYKWHARKEAAANRYWGRRLETDPIEEPESRHSAIDVVSMSGADILWCCGVKEPFENTDKLAFEDGIARCHGQERKYEFETVSLRREQEAEQRRKKQEQQRQEKGLWQGVGRRYMQPRLEKGFSCPKFPYEASVF